MGCEGNLLDDQLFYCTLKQAELDLLKLHKCALAIAIRYKALRACKFTANYGVYGLSSPNVYKDDNYSA